MIRGVISAALALLCGILLVSTLHAQAGADAAWLRYEALKQSATAGLPHVIVVVGRGEVLRTAANELVRALGREASSAGPTSGLPSTDAIVLGTWRDLRPLFPGLAREPRISGDGFWLGTVIRRDSGALGGGQPQKTGRHGGSGDPPPRGPQKYWLIAGADERGVLYGTFALLSRIGQGQNVATLDDAETPSAPIRWVNQWDNLDGSIERGYAGRSIFFDGGAVRSDLTRAGEYARLLASIGINGCAINNVNADARVLKPEFLPQLARVAEAFRTWGVRLAISVDLSSPMSAGGLKTFDPLNPQVEAWWRRTVDRIYRQIPDFGGFVMKADSEGRSGPSQYGRSAADAANVIARALRPHHGVMLYRAFVYNHHLDWRDPKADRAKAAYDYFHPLDGKFLDNVVLQIKYGPIDFQVREPVSPLFGAMPHTNQAIELQVTQEYTGQQRHLVYLVPLWKEVLDFDMHVHGVTLVKDIVSGQRSTSESGVRDQKLPPKRAVRRTAGLGSAAIGGYDAVVNVGLDRYWLGHPLAMANLFSYGRLAWNPNLSAGQIAQEWTRLTFGNDARVVDTITRMLLPSWRMYENYTGPLGLQTLTDITGPHYGPGIESSENNGWGQWHRADAKGVGMDRTAAAGTGFIGQYSPEVQKKYESVEQCPDDLLLFLHHVPYTFVLHSGKTVIQYLYDSHYAGADEAATLMNQWKSLHGSIDDARYAEVLKRQEYQAGHAMVWRDAVVNWFHRESGIPDAQGRVGHHPDRVEAENMQLSGYVPVDVTPWETASGGKAVACTGQGECSASFKFDRRGGKYDIAVQYFDLNNGASRFEMLVNDRRVDWWAADDHLPSDKMNGHTSTRRTVLGVELRTGDVVKMAGHPDGGEPAPLDYVEIAPARKTVQFTN
ncbi:MAG TPA: alpha-glucuronidase family glycosyl hydrolase [Terriglobales bacterium]